MKCHHLLDIFADLLSSISNPHREHRVPAESDHQPQWNVQEVLKITVIQGLLQRKPSGKTNRVSLVYMLDQIELICYVFV